MSKVLLLLDRNGKKASARWFARLRSECSVTSVLCYHKTKGAFEIHVYGKYPDQYIGFCEAHGGAARAQMELMRRFKSRERQ
jgi:hypothetical protein